MPAGNNNDNDPLSGFDWSRQDNLHSPPEPNSSIPPNPTPQPKYGINPGTYYANSFNNEVQHLTWGLKTYAIIEFISAGLTILSFLLSINAALTMGTSTNVGLCQSIISIFLSIYIGRGIFRFKKNAITLAWVLICLGWLCLAFSTVTILGYAPEISKGLPSTDQQYFYFILAFAVLIPITIILIKMILLALPSSRECARKFFH